MKTHFILGIITLLLACCQGTANNSDDTLSKSTVNDEGYTDNTYCAEVKYHNPKTGTQSSYTLTVKVESNEISEIDWPNGGKLDGDDFSSASIDENGHSSFTSGKGYEYEVQIIGQSEGCFNNVPMVKQCNGETKNGSRCKHMTDNSNQLCWQHQNQE